MLTKEAKIAELFDVYEGYLYNEKVFIEMKGSIITQVLYMPGTALVDIKRAIYEVDKIEESSGINHSEMGLPENLIIEKVYEVTLCEVNEAEFDVIETGEICGELSTERQSKNESVETNNVDEGEYKKYLIASGVSSPILAWAIKYRAYNQERLKDAPDTVIDLIPKLEILWIGKTKILEKALISLMLKQPLNLKGEAATGKTTLVKTIAQILYLPLYIVNGSVEAKKNTFVGEYTVEKSEMVVKRGQLTLAMDKNYYGGMLYVDEINMLKADVLSIINPVTDGSGYFYNDVEKANIYEHPDFHFVSAMNFANYAGTKKLNIATFDRTAAIVLKTPDKKTIKELITKHAEKVNAVLEKQNFPKVEAYDVANLSDIYVQVISSKLSAEAKSFRNIVLMLKYITTIGYANALEMWLDKIQNEAERAKTIGILSQNDLLNRLKVQPAELIG